MTAIGEAAPPKRAQTGFPAARIVGWFLMALWVVLGIELVWKLTSDFDAEFFNKYFPTLLQGLLVTLELVTLTMVLAGFLSIPVALARVSKNRLVSGAAYVYVYFFRGTPLLAQTFLVYYGAGQLRPTLEDANLWWFFRDAFNCVILAFTLNEAAYLAEIVRGAIQAVPRGQIEAAQSLGIPKYVTFWKVVVPQAMIIALRPFGNEIILMIKASAVASVVTVFDLMGATRLAFARSFNFDIYLWAALIYLSIVEILRRVWDRLERRLTRHIGYRSSK
jgi:polar amino acid transport system permease protein